MINHLSFEIRSSAIWEGESGLIVDFKVDSESIWQRMMRLAPGWMDNPKGNRDGRFVGVCVEEVLRNEDFYRTGYHPWYNYRAQRSVIPLLGCGDCGSFWCGGIWTRIFVGPRRVFWSDLGFCGGAEDFAPIYDRATFVFDREQYEQVFSVLIQEIHANLPSYDDT